jgi:hypothetical protein
MATRQVAGAGVAGGVLVLAAVSIAAFALADTNESRFTSNEAVDAIIQDIDTGDVAALMERARTQQVPCSRAADGDSPAAVQPPVCPLGSPEGAPQDVFLSGECENAWIPGDAVPATFEELFGEPTLTYAVLFMDGEAQEAMPVLSQYRIVYGRPTEPEFPFSGHIAVLDGEIIQLSAYCANAAQQVSYLADLGGDIVFALPELPTEVE